MNYLDVHTINDIDKLPDVILVDRDYDVLHTLVSIGLIESVDGDGTTEPDTWQRFYEQEYHGLFVLLDDSGCNYLAVWGFCGCIPWLDKSLELIYYQGELLV